MAGPPATTWLLAIAFTGMMFLIPLSFRLLPHAAPLTAARPAPHVLRPSVGRGAVGGVGRSNRVGV
ncbi:hypothetical protein [Streptomyces sp. YIM S03343]